jgi:hypothetical protein
MKLQLDLAALPAIDFARGGTFSLTAPVMVETTEQAFDAFGLSHRARLSTLQPAGHSDVRLALDFRGRDKAQPLEVCGEYELHVYVALMPRKR